MNADLKFQLITLVAAAAGALGGSWLSGRYAADLEKEKWCRAQEDERSKELRSKIAEYQRHVARAVVRANVVVELVSDTAAPPGQEQQTVYKAEMNRIHEELQAAYLQLRLYRESKALSEVHKGFYDKEAQFRTLVRNEPVPSLPGGTVQTRFAEAYKQLTGAASAYSVQLSELQRSETSRDEAIRGCIERRQ